MPTLTTLTGHRPVTALTAGAICIVDGLPWPAHVPPLARLLRLWPRHLHAAAAAAVARIGTGVEPVTTVVDLAQLGGFAPSSSGWWIVTWAGEATAIWVEMIVDEGVLMPGWWWACAPERLVDRGSEWPETRWDPRGYALPLDRLREQLSVRTRGLTAVRAVLGMLAEQSPGRPR